MIWRENGTEVFVVETEQALYVKWVIQRMTARIQRQYRDKAISDAIWATLFSSPDCSQDMTRCLLSPPGCSRALCITGAHFPGREAAIITLPWSKRWALVFESPWEADRGHRVRRVIQQLPNDVTPERVWIWEPRAFTQTESQIVLYYIAAGRALRCAMLEQTQGRGIAWLIAALRRAYISASPQARKTVLTCFDEGFVVSDGGVHTPVIGAEHLMPTLEALAGWLQPGEPEVCALHYVPPDTPPQPDILPVSTYSYDSARSLNALVGLPQKIPIL
ncbi:MAG: hypothetical protein ACP5J4_12475 [Anaerolineae bacterium]